MWIVNYHLSLSFDLLELRVDFIYRGITLSHRPTSHVSLELLIVFPNSDARFSTASSTNGLETFDFGVLNLSFFYQQLSSIFCGASLGTGFSPLMH